MRNTIKSLINSYFVFHKSVLTPFYGPTDHFWCIHKHFQKHMYSITNGAEQLSLLLIFFFFYSGALTRFFVMTSLYEALRSHSLDTPQLVELFWTSDRPDAENSTCRHTTLTETETHAPSGVVTSHSSKRAAADPHLRTGSAFITDIINLLIK